MVAVTFFFGPASADIYPQISMGPPGTPLRIVWNRDSQPRECLTFAGTARAPVTVVPCAADDKNQYWHYTLWDNRLEWLGDGGGKCLTPRSGRPGESLSFTVDDCNGEAVFMIETEAIAAPAGCSTCPEGAMLKNGGDCLTVSTGMDPKELLSEPCNSTDPARLNFDLFKTWKPDACGSRGDGSDVWGVYMQYFYEGNSKGNTNNNVFAVTFNSSNGGKDFIYGGTYLNSSGNDNNNMEYPKNLEVNKDAYVNVWLDLHFVNSIGNLNNNKYHWIVDGKEVPCNHVKMHVEGLWVNSYANNNNNEFCAGPTLAEPNTCTPWCDCIFVHEPGNQCSDPCATSCHTTCCGGRQQCTTPCKTKVDFCKEICSGLGYDLKCRIQCVLHFEKVESIMDGFCKNGECAVAFSQVADRGAADTAVEEASLLQQHVARDALAVSRAQNQRSPAAASMALRGWCKKPCDYCRELCHKLSNGCTLCNRRCEKAWASTIKPLFSTYCTSGSCPCTAAEMSKHVAQLRAWAAGAVGLIESDPNGEELEPESASLLQSTISGVGSAEL